MRYEDFILQIGPDRGQGHVVRVLQSPAGESEGRLHLPRARLASMTAAGPLRHGVLSSESSESSPREGGTGEGGPGDGDRGLTAGEAIELIDDRAGLAAGLSAGAIGQMLFAALFDGPIRRTYDESIGVVKARGDCGLRLKLRLNPRHPELAELYSLPWELLYDADLEQFLSLSRMQPVVRYLEVPRAIPPLPLPAPLRVVVVIANPRDLETLDLGHERREIVRAWSMAGNVEVTVLETGSAHELRRTLLAQPFHVLHFMGHGDFDSERGEGRLLFEGADGDIAPLSGRSLAMQLADFKSLRLVFLNACDSARAGDHSPFAGVATALVLSGMPAVLAMQVAISDHAAVVFSKTFYRALATGDPADAAVTEGRMAVYLDQPEGSEWGTPVLFMRTPDGMLFAPDDRADPTPTPASRPETTPRPPSLPTPIPDPTPQPPHAPGPRPALEPHPTLEPDDGPDDGPLPQPPTVAAEAFATRVVPQLGRQLEPRKPSTPDRRWWSPGKPRLSLLARIAALTLGVAVVSLLLLDRSLWRGYPRPDALLDVPQEPETGPTTNTQTAAPPAHAASDTAVLGTEVSGSSDVDLAGGPSIAGVDQAPTDPAGDTRPGGLLAGAAPHELGSTVSRTRDRTSTRERENSRPEGPSQAGAEARADRSWHVEPIIGLRLRRVSAARFLMGSPAGERGRASAYERQRPVTLRYDFWIGETEVTQEQWLKLVSGNPSGFPDVGGRAPVENVTWFEAASYANRLSERAGLPPCFELTGCQSTVGDGQRCNAVRFRGLTCRGYRLPTEAEWEMAARAGGGAAFGHQTTPHTDRINFFPACASCGYPGMTTGQPYPFRPRRVASLQANAWRLHDLLGNVGEWSLDRYARGNGSAATDPLVERGGTRAPRAIRGGSWASPATACRVAARAGVPPHARSNQIGFRLVRTASRAR